MFRPEQTDPLGAEIAGHAGVFRRVRIGAHTHFSVFVGHGHEPLEPRVFRGVDHRQGTYKDVTPGAVQRNHIPLLQHGPGAGDFRRLVRGVHMQGPGAHDAALAPPAGNQRRMGGHAAAGGQDADSRAHPLDVLRIRLLPQQDAVPAGTGGSNRVLRSENQFTAGGAGAGRQPPDNRQGLLLGVRIDDRMEDFVQLSRLDAHDGGRLVDKPFIQHIDCNVQRGHTGSLAGTTLQHPEFPLLDGKFDVHHIGEATLQLGADRVEFAIDLRHGVLHARQMPVLVVPGVIVDRRRGPDAGNHILTLCIHQPFSIKPVFAGGGIAGKGNAGSGGVAHIAEDHGLDVHRGTPVVRNLFDPAVGDGFLAVPTFKHRRYGAPQLFDRVVRKGLAEMSPYQLLEGSGERLEVAGAEIRIELAIPSALQLVQFFIQDLANPLAQGRFEAFRLLHHHIGVHHDQATVRIPDESGVGRFGDHARDRRGAQPNVENGIHHARHRQAGAGATGDQ